MQSVLRRCGGRIPRGGTHNNTMQRRARTEARHPDADVTLKSLLKKRERELCGSNTTFVRKRRGVGRTSYPGWIKWQETLGGAIVAEVQTRVANRDWKLLHAFIGYLDRHLGDHIQSLTITYR